MKIKSENKWIVLLVILFTLFSSIAISFAYFTAVVTVNGNISSISGTADSRLADITLTNLTSNVTLSNSYPLTDEEALASVTPYSFQVTNNSSTRGATVSIVVETLSTNTLADNYVSARIGSTYGALTDTNVFQTTVNTLSGYNHAYKIYTDSLAPSQTKTYDLRLYLNSTGTNDLGANDIQNKTWGGKIVVKAVDAEPPVHIISKAGSNLTTGDKIAIGDENFWVISNTNGTIRALAEYNINVGSNKNTSVPEGLQHSTVRGPYSGGTTYGNVAFSNSGTSYSGSLLKSYIDDYVTLLNSTYGTSVTGDAITHDELTNIFGCEELDSCPATSNGKDTSWIYTTTYWTGSANDDYNVWCVYTDGYFGLINYYGAYSSGVRPVISISESSI